MHGTRRRFSAYAIYLLFSGASPFFFSLIILSPILLLLAYAARKIKAAESVPEEEITTTEAPEPV
jgi:hypothetical protein